MKITEYPSIGNFTEDNILLVDGAAGTKTILVQDAVFAMLELVSPMMRRVMLRGKNLGTAVTEEQLANIQNGSFKDLWLGDYWEINGKKWRIADFDYWYGIADPDHEFNKHHLVVVPDGWLYTGAMHSSADASGAYLNSTMRATGLAETKSAVTAAFGDAVLTHRERFASAADGGVHTNSAWADSTVEVPSQVMMCGWSAAEKETTSFKQLALFAVDPSYIFLDGNSYWMRDVAADGGFVAMSYYGAVIKAPATNVYGIRPVFAIG